MKMADNVETEAIELKASDSRASRMARYSAAAAGVAAVSSIEVDAAMIKVVVNGTFNSTLTHTNPANSYSLDLSAIKAGASLNVGLYVSTSSSSLFITNLTGASYAGSHWLTAFKEGSKIGSSIAYRSTGTGWFSSPGVNFFGFRVLNSNSSGYTYGWLKTTYNGGYSATLNSYGYNSTLNEAAIAGQGSSSSQVPDSGPGILGLALIGAGAAGVRLLRKLRAGK